jgi:hydrophobic/amphiphilic exporter-1 (mainly G- bacteria), HAE1 family
MNLAKISVERPIFVSAILAAIIVMGIFAFNKMPVDLFPDITFPVVTVTTIYKGAGPQEVETLVAKPLEEELSTLSGVKSLRSINLEGVSNVIAEFTLETDVKYAEQQVRDRVSAAKKNLPKDIDEPTIKRIDPADQPIMIASIQAPLNPAQMYDLANEFIKPRLEQVAQVGRVDLLGGRKREIQVQLDRNKIRDREIPVTAVAQSLNNTGQNIPAGKIAQTNSDIVFRTLGEFESINQIKNQVVRFVGNDVTTTIGDLGEVRDGLIDEKTRAFYNKQPTVFLYVYKQSGSNTVKVGDSVSKKINDLQTELSLRGPDYKISLVRDTTRIIRANIFDVQESILIGVALTILVVWLFLGSLRSTMITGLAIPFSLIGGMALMYAAGFSINIMTLLALSLAVGLLIDDAIVVRENIFRHLEMGKSPKQAALDGTKEVAMAVVAVTMAILAVFGPIAFLSGVVGQFFKSFGLTICFVMAISLFDALTNAPMLSAYFGGRHKAPTFFVLVRFDQFQNWLERKYEGLLKSILKFPGRTLLATLGVVILLGFSVKFISKTFLPPQDNGEFAVSIELPIGANLDMTHALAKKVDDVLHQNPELTDTILVVGNTLGENHKADFFVTLKPFGKRKKKTSEVKNEIREALNPFRDQAALVVKDIDMVSGGQRPFNVYIRGDKLEDIQKVSLALLEKMKSHPAVSEPEMTDKPGLPEFQIKVDPPRAQMFGVSTATVGAELRAQVEGLVAAKYRERGLEYDIRVRMQEGQRDLEASFNSIKVPNLNGRMVPVNGFSKGIKDRGVATINRDNRGRYIGIGADIRADGPGMGGLITDINKWFTTKEIAVPEGVTYRFVGQAENFQELGASMAMAGLLGIIFIFLVLASLYESVVTPFTIMLVIPLAIFGGFFGLLVFRSSLDLFSMIGIIMLMGLATKNSIILVDYINQQRAEGKTVNEAILAAGKTRLRPILMTSFALIAGMIPVAIGLNEASNQRTSLGIAVIGGVSISTLLTLLVIPAVFGYIERFRAFMIKKVGSKMISE